MTTKIKALKFRFSLVFVLVLFGTPTLHAKEIVILYTGETHGMLYTCSCPKEPDGGVARRATLVEKLRVEHPGALLLDSGSFFAGGLLDEYTQNTDMDMKRTLVNLAALKLMKYDALNIGDDEFNFGLDFFLKNAADKDLGLLSCNIQESMEPVKIKSVRPYLIKEVAGIKIGIIGVTNLTANSKAGSLKFSDPKAGVVKAVEELKNKGVLLIVLLSQLEESQDLSLIQEVKGIDILIGSHHAAGEKPFTKFQNTLLLKAFWQGRSLGKVTLTVEDNKLVNFKVEGLRLSDEVADDPKILSILPRCFSDANCRKEGLVGTCQEPGSLSANCLFTQPNRVDLVVITSKSCITCNTEMAVNFFKKNFPGLNPTYLYYPEKKALDLIKGSNVSALPAYLLSKAVEKEDKFGSFKANLEPKGDYYLVKPQLSGVSYFFNRTKIKGKLDLFISLFDKGALELLEVVREFEPTIHFLATDEQGKLDAAKGLPEVEEYLRAVCVQKCEPQQFWDYITCRAKNINSTWWEDCALSFNTDKIKSCAKGSEGLALLKENIGMNKELQILLGPTYLLDNQEIFGSNGVPKKEELRSIIKR